MKNPFKKKPTDAELLVESLADRGDDLAGAIAIIRNVVETPDLASAIDDKMFIQECRNFISATEADAERLLVVMTKFLDKKFPATAEACRRLAAERNVLRGGIMQRVLLGEKKK